MTRDPCSDGADAGCGSPRADTAAMRQDAPDEAPHPAAVLARLHADSAVRPPMAPTPPPARVAVDPDAARLWGELDEVRRRLHALRGPHADDARAGSAAEVEAVAAPKPDSGVSAAAHTRRTPAEPMPELVAARLRRALIAQDPPTEAAAVEAGTAPPRPARRRVRRFMIGAAAVIAVGLGAAAPALWEAAHATGSTPTVTARQDPRAVDGAVAGRTLPAAAGGDAAAEPPAHDRAAAPGTAVTREHRSHASVPPAAEDHVRENDPESSASAPGATRDTPAAALGTDELRRVQAAQDPGPFADSAALRRCLRANGVPAGSHLLGAGPVRVHGRDGTLLLIPGPRPPALTALVVTEACGSGRDGLLYRTDIGPP